MLNIGDTIKCSAEEITEIMVTLENMGYGTEFLYEKDGEHGLWLEIIKVPKELF